MGDTVPDGSRIDSLVDEYKDNRIDRRDFVRRATAAGISVTAASSLAAYLDSPALARRAASGGGSGTAAGPKTYVFGTGRDLTSVSLDPANNSCDCRGFYMDGTFEGLVQPMPQIASGGQLAPKHKIVKVLADKYDVAKDGLSVEFTLKKGVRFHGNYGEVTADDVKFSYERSAGIVPLYPDAASGDVALNGTNWAQLDHVQVTGKYTGKILFKQRAHLSENIALPYSSTGNILSRKAVQALRKNGVATVAIGTGPYVYGDRNPPKSHTLTRWDKWDKHWNRPTYWDEIKFDWSPAQPGQPITVPLEAGEVDFEYRGLSVADYERLANNPNFRGYLGEQPGFVAILVNPTHPALKDVRVRRAVRLATDVQALLQLAHQPANTRLWSIISKQAPVGYWAGAPHWSRDVAQAKSLLAQAGASNLSLDLIDMFPTPGQAELFQAQLGEAGIKVNILKSYPADWFAKPAGSRPALVGARYGANFDPSYYFQYFTSGQIGAFNWAFWSNNLYGTKNAYLLRTQNVKQQQQLSVELQKLMAKSECFIWLYDPIIRFLTSKRVKAAFDDLMIPYPTFFAPA
jgi:peptide/nickel transport system substrate-binding protein